MKSSYCRENTIQEIHQRAQLVLTVFTLTFIAARILVFLIMEEKIPDLFLYIGQTHIHHLNYGIFLLSFVGGYLLLVNPQGHRRTFSAVIYGIGLALTFDEFGRWLHLGGSYWQRASFDAITVIIAIFSLILLAPKFSSWRPHHYWSSLVLLVVIPVFFFMLFNSLKSAEERIQKHMQKIERSSDFSAPE